MAYVNEYINQYNKYSRQPGVNGINGFSAFKEWECYMLLKYGHPNEFGLAGKYEYLIELPIYPDEVSESISANWGKQSVLGRSAALSAYANTDLKSVSFSMDLHRDLLTGSLSLPEESAKSFGYRGGASVIGINGKDQSQIAGYQQQSKDGPFDTRTWYININKMLQMSCYPQYTDNGLVPPTTYFIFGQMILKGYVTSYSTSWKKPIINTFYAWNTVQIQMECYPDTIISAHDIISGQGAASTQNTYNTKFPGGNAVRSNTITRSDTNNRYNARSDYATKDRGGTPGGQVMDVG